MKLYRASLLAALFASLTASGAASAHPITVDGSAAEWFTRVPNSDNLGLIARDAAKAGEYIWRDVANDARTDLASPEIIAEITGVQITGTPNGFGVLVRNVPGAVQVGKPIQVQLAIDVDRVAGSGNDFMAAFADTKVHDSARWEFLVQTLFGSGGQATVLDKTYASVAPAQAAQGPNGVEIFVPWSAIGLNGPPSAPLRFSLATFRAEANDLTVDIGMSGVSNVIDAVTDYGDPRAAMYPNTFQDVQDLTLDYFFDVFFNAQGEVYAPLVVQRFVANAGASGEWFAVKNVSPIALPIEFFKLGDEETPDGAEGMLQFPTGAALAAGATYIVAANALNYQTAFGSLPDAELGNTVIAVPKMKVFNPWAAGSLALNNAGDELLVLDASNTLLDIAVYGNVTYAGITTKTPAPAANVVLTRDAVSSDTDDCQVDFTAATSCANDAACGSACKQCLGGVCVNKAQGTSCADATVCNGAEVCDAAGTCVAGQALNCDDGKVCTVDACDPVTGCSNTPKPVGTSCDDGDACNGTEACDAAGACVTLVPGMCDDNNPCTADSCDMMMGCLHTNLPMGTSCDDGDPCNGVSACNGMGACLPGPAPSCNDNNACTSDACVPNVGCVSTPLPMGTSCNDNNACNGADTCNGQGTCVSSGPLNCNDNDPCTSDVCDPMMGCQHPPAPAGTMCSDGDPCNGSELCNGAGMCLAGAPLNCDDMNDCTADSCDMMMGCLHAPVPMGTACASDPNCTGQTCNANGMCGGGNCGMGGAGGMGAGGMGTGGMGTGGMGGMGNGGMGGAGSTGSSSTGSTSTSSSGNTSSSSTSSSGEGGGSSGSGGGINDPGSCGCKVVGDDESGNGSGAPMAALGLLAIASIRRRRRG